MKFHAIPINQAQGLLLGHNIAGANGRRLLRKGHPLTAADVALLHEIGRETVYVAQLEAGDVPENEAAQIVATAVAGPHLRLSKAVTGRANLHATALGLLRVDEERLMQINLCEAVTLATLANHSVVRPRQMVGTLKIIAYAIAHAVVAEAETIGRGGLLAGAETRPLVQVQALPARRVGLILSGSPSAELSIVESFSKALQTRLQSWGSGLSRVDFMPLEDEQGEADLAQRIQQQVDEGLELIILAGETAIMDRYDIAPRAVERAGGRVIAFGAPVDPGNLLMVAQHGRVPIVGAPGCARSPKRNIVDLVLPRLLAGDYLTKMDIVKLGHAGLLEDVRERGRPRKLS